MIHTRRLSAGVLVAAVLASACSSTWRGPQQAGDERFARVAAANPDGCVDRFDPNTDYFPDKAVFDAARQVTVDYHGHYKLMTVTFRGFSDNTAYRSVERYVLVQCGTPAPAITGDLTGASVVTIPAKTVTVTSNEDLGMMIALGLRDQIKSVGSRAIWDDALWEKFKAGNLMVTFGWGTSEIHVEWMLNLKPDVVIVGAFQSQAALNVQRARDVGLQTVPSLTRIESTPLGRAEWLKALSTLFNLERTANATYAHVASRYGALARQARAAAPKPRAFWAPTYASGVWLAHRNTFSARLLEDAGADNALADEGPTVTMTVGPELVIDHAADADYWITENSDLLRADGSASIPGTPVEALKPVRLHHVYNLAGRYRRENNSADYYQSGPYRPDLLLEDLVSIFHPSLMPNHSLYFMAAMPDAARVAEGAR